MDFFHIAVVLTWLVLSALFAHAVARLVVALIHRTTTDIDDEQCGNLRTSLMYGSPCMAVIAVVAPLHCDLTLTNLIGSVILGSMLPLLAFVLWFFSMAFKGIGRLFNLFSLTHD